MDYGRIRDYLWSLEGFENKQLSDMRAYAEMHDVPIVRLETESFLRTMTKLKAPRRILEIGTAIGYSTIVMAEASAETEAEIVTIESYDLRVPIARKNIREAGYEPRVKLIHGDAGEELRKLSGTFDLVFLDAAKGQYINWLPDILAHMAPGALLIADNVLQDNTVMESRFTVERRDRTTHERMRAFLYEIKHCALLESSVLPLGDGVSISVMTAP